jgi:hypothetical protein
MPNSRDVTIIADVKVSSGGIVSKTNDERCKERGKEGKLKKQNEQEAILERGNRDGACG